VQELLTVANQRWCDDCALYSQLCQLPVEYKPCRAGFTTRPQLVGWPKLLDQLADRLFPVDDRSHAAYLAIRLGDGYRFGVDIQTQKF
jgi:hypothetical protein